METEAGQREVGGGGQVDSRGRAVKKAVKKGFYVMEQL